MPRAIPCAVRLLHVSLLSDEAPDVTPPRARKAAGQERSLSTKAIWMEALALTQLRSGLLEGLVGDFNGILIYIYIYMDIG